MFMSHLIFNIVLLIFKFLLGVGHWRS